jgi:phage gp45-like
MTRSGAPVAGAAVMIAGDSPSHLDIAAVTSASGEYRFAGLLPGDYAIEVNAGDRLHTRRVAVTDTGAARLDFVVDD